MRRNAETTREKALAGQVLDAGGMSRSLIIVGNMTVKPETKYSYIIVSASKGMKLSREPIQSKFAT